MIVVANLTNASVSANLYPPFLKKAGVICPLLFTKKFFKKPEN